MKTGASRKSTGWGIGSWLVGVATGLELVNVLTPLNIGLGRWMLMWFVLGVLLSIPFGISWLRGQVRIRDTFKSVERVESYTDDRGHTHSTVHRRVSGPPRPAPTQAWGFAGTVLVRWPVTLGDAVLSLIWGLISRVSGATGARWGFGMQTTQPPEGMGAGGPRPEDRRF